MLLVEIWSDINCPFCYIGKKHLEDALEQFPKKDEVKIEWKSFELDPDFKATPGMNMIDHLASKYGKTHEWAKQMQQNITQMAAECGIIFKMEDIVPANSFHAHRLLHLAKKFNLQNDLKDKLLAARFTHGKDIGDKLILKNLATNLGLPENEVDEVLQGEIFSQDVRKDERQASELGISGVPFFVFNKKSALSGAQPTETFLQVLKEQST